MRFNTICSLLCILSVGSCLFAAEERELKREGDFVYSVKDVAERRANPEGISLYISADHGQKGNIPAVQWATPYAGGLTAGKTYRAELTVKTTRDGRVFANIMDHDNPWKQHVSQAVDCKANEVKTITLKLKPETDIKGKVRAPGLFLGLLPVDTHISITNVKFVEEK